MEHTGTNFQTNTSTYSLYNTNMPVHFRVTEAFTFIFVFLSILSMANPLSSSPRNNIVENGLEERQAADIIIEGEQSSIHHTTNAANLIPQSSSM